MKFTRRVLMTTAAAVMALSTPAFADGHQKVESIHFLIPGGAGGGWDGTARGTGQALTEAGLVGSASYENMSGGGGGKAIGYLIENAASQEGTLMVNSTPIVIRSLTGIFPITLLWLFQRLATFLTWQDCWKLTKRTNKALLSVVVLFQAVWTTWLRLWS